MKYSLSSVSKKLGIPKKQLKEDIRDGNLRMSDGMLLADDVKMLYPNEFCAAITSCNLDYYDALKETAGNWKDGAREKVEQLDKHLLVNQIRKLEAENYALKKRIENLETKLRNINGNKRSD